MAYTYSVPSSPVVPVRLWCPQTPGAPAFQNYRADEPVISALTQTQVALFEQVRRGG